MAVIAATGLRFDCWLRRALPLYLLPVRVGVAAILSAIAIDLQ